MHVVLLIQKETEDNSSYIDSNVRVVTLAGESIVDMVIISGSRSLCSGGSCC